MERAEHDEARQVEAFIDSGRTNTGEDALPFFIAYDGDPANRLGRWEERYRETGNQGFGGFTFIEVAGDEHKIRSVAGGADLPIRVVDGRTGLRAVCIAGLTGEIVLRDDI